MTLPAALTDPPPRGTVHWQAAGTDGIARLTLAHPGKLNALSVSMWRGLHAAADAAARDTALRVLIVRGDGGQFVAGADIEEFPAFRHDAAALAHYHEAIVAPALEALWALDVPVVAQIDGACVGGGLEIAAMCDWRLGAADSRFGVPIARLGFPMAPREIELCALALGAPLLRELLLGADLMDAATAHARGVLARVLPPGEVAVAAEHEAARLAALSTEALRRSKRLLRRHANGVPSSAAERHAAFDFADHPDHREGLAAFLARRRPHFL